MQRHAVRNASTTSEAASNMATKAKETMSQVTSKASEGLTKVTSSASESASSAASGTASQGRIGGMISTVQCKLYDTEHVPITSLRIYRQ